MNSRFNNAPLTCIFDLMYLMYYIPNEKPNLDSKFVSFQPILNYRVFFETSCNKKLNVFCAFEYSS